MPPPAPPRRIPTIIVLALALVVSACQGPTAIEDVAQDQAFSTCVRDAGTDPDALAAATPQEQRESLAEPATLRCLLDTTDDQTIATVLGALFDPVDPADPDDDQVQARVAFLLPLAGDPDDDRDMALRTAGIARLLHAFDVRDDESCCANRSDVHPVHNRLAIELDMSANGPSPSMTAFLQDNGMVDDPSGPLEWWLRQADTDSEDFQRIEPIVQMIQRARDDG